MVNLSIKMRQEDIERRINEFRNDSICLYYKERIRLITLFHPKRWFIKNGKVEPIVDPEVRKLEFELNEYINNNYSDLFNGNSHHAAAGS